MYVRIANINDFITALGRATILESETALKQVVQQLIATTKAPDSTAPNRILKKTWTFKGEFSIRFYYKHKKMDKSDY